MIFDGVKAVTIPEGAVKRIESGGKVLWERPGELSWNIALSIAYARVSYYGSTRVDVTVTVTGIPGSQLQKMAGYLQSYSEDQGKYNSILPVSGWKKTQQDETTAVYTGQLQRWYDPASLNLPRIAAELTYTAPDGSTQVLSGTVDYV